MNNKKIALMVYALPFVVVLIAVILCCIVLASPIIGLVFIVKSFNETRYKKDKLKKRLEYELNKRNEFN